MPAWQMASGAQRVTSRPRKRMRPASGRRTPEMTWKRVVFPAPFGPISPTSCPASTSRSTSLRARTPPKRFETFRTSSSAMRVRLTRQSPPVPRGLLSRRRPVRAVGRPHRREDHDLPVLDLSGVEVLLAHPVQDAIAELHVVVEPVRAVRRVELERAKRGHESLAVERPRGLDTPPHGLEAEIANR